MKRYLCMAILLIMTISLTSCSEAPQVDADFSATFAAKIDEAEYAGDITADESGLSITMTQPYTVQGMRFDYYGGALSVDYGGHSVRADTGYLPCESVASALHETLAYLNQAEYRETKDGEDSFTLPTPHGSVALTAKDGALQTMTVPEYRMTFTFEPIG